MDKMHVGNISWTCPHCANICAIPVYAWTEEVDGEPTMNFYTSADPSSAWFHYLEHSYEGDFDD